jgi:diguanylate cyclase (GGDEF)-like protein/PAS domain S-box-containing protein
LASSSDPKRGSGSSTPDELLTAAFDDATIGMAIIMVGATPGDDRILRCNYALCSITGHSETVLLEGGLALLDLSSESRQSERLRSTGAGRGRVEFEHSMTTADGNLIWVMITLSTVRQETGGSEYRLLQIQDISDRRDYESRLQFLAGHDPLTGLTNVRRLIEVMDQGFAYQSRYGGDAALLSFDLDNFKAVNDSIGHAEGDRTLKAFAARIKDHSRGADTVARLGGDEFAIFLPGTNLADATSVGNAILADLRKNPVAIGAQGVELLTLSASIGATALNGRDDIQAPDLILEADAAMYSAKAGGRNQIAPFPVDKPKKMWEKTRLTWAERTRRALDADDLFLDAQPVRRIGTGATVFHEVLLRMNDPEEGIVYPPSFLYTAERFGLSTEIDSWVFKTALAALARSSDTKAQVSINLTGSSLSNSSGFLNEIPQMIKAAGVDSSRIIFELTEQVVISDLERARSFIEEVREIGCRFALDDFGAGFGGFYYLKNLPMDILKIDGEFVRSLTDSKEDQVIVRAITEMGQGMNLEIVAEYVINAATESLCGDLGVDMAQGSFIGPPVRIEQALGLDQ